MAEDTTSSPPAKKLKKKVSFPDPKDDETGTNDTKSSSPSSPSRRPTPRRSMGPRQQSLPAFAPDNYPDDDDDKYASDDEFFSTCPPDSADAQGGPTSTPPGEGWTNGQIPPQFTPTMTLHPYTRRGRLSLYSHHRRYINFQSAWSRIGEGSTELDAVHKASYSGESLLTKKGAQSDQICLVEEAKTVRALVSQLCETFYHNGWATGTGGGVSIRVGGKNRPYRVFVAPSGVMKEDMIGNDIFELDMDRNVVEAPKTPNLRQSACTPLWYVVYRHVPSAMCVIHTHSMYAQLATLLDPTEESSVLRVTHLEMLKGVGNHSYDSVLEIPIIDNRPTEDLLASQLESVILKYPKCNAVLVRRHGVYVWGDSWEQAKSQCESFDYLFQSAVKMKQMGMDPGLAPKSGTYREEDVPMDVPMADNVAEEKKEEPSDADAPLKKRPRTSEGATTTPAPAFNAASSTSNDADLQCSDPTTIPLLPRDAKHLLLDIEGTTTSISFVKDTLFPYVLTHLESYVNGMSIDDLIETYAGVHSDVEKLDSTHPTVMQLKQEEVTMYPSCNDVSESDLKTSLISLVKALMAHDVKATGLKSLQGKMWKSGYNSGELIGHLYSDFIPLLNWCKENDVNVCIYSSGSIAAQKLLFAHTAHGDLTSNFCAHFDTTSGSKKESTSYTAIAKSLGVGVEEVVFASDLEAELRAAREAGMRAVMAVRPGNAVLSEDVKKEFPLVRSLLQLCGSD